MKKITTLLIVVMSFGICRSQVSEIVGDWLLESITENGQAVEPSPYEIMTFSGDGALHLASFFNQAIASWELDHKSKTILFSSKFDDFTYNGKKEVSFPDDNTMVIAMTAEQNYHFRKLDWESINFNHRHSGLLGTWKLAPLDKYDDGTVNVLIFEENGKYTYISSSVDGTTQSSKDIWLYNHLEKNLLMGSAEPLHFGGKSIVLEVTPTKFTIKNKYGKLEATKVMSGNNDITELDFDSDFQSDESDKLPVVWKMFDKTLHFLEPIKQLTYDLGVKIKGVEVLKYSLIEKKVNVNLEKQSVNFTNIHITPIDTMQYSENYKGNMMEMDNYFFPETEPDKFRIVGTEKITVPAGMFLCTVVEAISDDKKLKYWLINNQPGIYAQIIEQEKSRFSDETNYKIMKLKEIKE